MKDTSIHLKAGSGTGKLSLCENAKADEEVTENIFKVNCGECLKALREQFTKSKPKK